MRNSEFYNSDSKEFFKSNFCPHLCPRGCLPLERQKVLCGLSRAFGVLLEADSTFFPPRGLELSPRECEYSPRSLFH